VFKIARKTFAVLLGCCVCATVSLPKRVGAEEVRATLPSPLTQEQLKRRYPIFSQADLDVIVAKLKQPATKMDALTTLIHCANFRLYQIGSVMMVSYDPSLTNEQNQLMNNLADQATKAIRENTDFDLISHALDSSDGDLQFWGLWVFPGSEVGLSLRPNWSLLLPRVKELAVEGDGRVRAAAIQELQRHSEFKKFLEERLNAETEPRIVLNPLYQRDRFELSQRFMPFLIRLLNHQDEEVRCQTLLFIGFNHNSTTMWQVSFDERIVARVTELTKSTSKKEKEAALYALQGMKEKPWSNP